MPPNRHVPIKMGAMYPKFKHENVAQVSTGFGGLLYMIISAIYMTIIIILESGPVYIIFMTGLWRRPITTEQWGMIVGAFILVIAITVFAIYKPMKMGMDALEKYE